MKYKVMMANAAGELETLVNEAIDDGWTPIGGVSVIQDSENSPYQHKFCQAVIGGPEEEPAKFNADMVRELRHRSGLGLTYCRHALEQCNGDMDQAEKWLKENGWTGNDGKPELE